MDTYRAVPDCPHCRGADRRGGLGRALVQPFDGRELPVSRSVRLPVIPGAGATATLVDLILALLSAVAYRAGRRTLREIP